MDSVPGIPSILFCVAGGTSSELGFFADLSANQVRECFSKNYFSAAFITQCLLQQWLKEPHQPPRHIILTGSTSAFISLPGYAAYSPTKAALRSLADTLRQEVMMYPHDIRVHCSFPGTILTEIFYEEQEKKPVLTKLLEGSDDPEDGQTPQSIARAIFAGLKKGQYFITTDFNTLLLLNNARGLSPASYGILDWLLGILVSLAWPFVQIFFDRKIRTHGSASGK